MPRHYKNDGRAEQYKKVDSNIMEHAKHDVGLLNNGGSIIATAKHYGIPYTVSYRHVKYPNLKKHGGQTALTKDEEELLVQRIALCADWGYPMNSYDVDLL